MKTFEKLLVENFPETFGWKLFRNLKTFGNFINKLSRNLTSGWKLLLLVGNFPETFGWKLSRNLWLETFQKLLVGNFPETSGWKLLLLVGNFPETSC